MSNLASELRDAADACTPSPLQDLLRRAADAVDVKQEPVAYLAEFERLFATKQIGGRKPVQIWANSNDLVVDPNWSPDEDDDYLGVQWRNLNIIPLYTNPAPIPDSMMMVPDGWKIVEKEFGIILVEHPEIGGVLIDPCDRKNPIAADILHALAEAMLKPAGESS